MNFGKHVQTRCKRKKGETIYVKRERDREKGWIGRGKGNLTITQQESKLKDYNKFVKRPYHTYVVQKPSSSW